LVVAIIEDRKEGGKGERGIIIDHHTMYLIYPFKNTPCHYLINKGTWKKRNKGIGKIMKEKEKETKTAGSGIPFFLE
jgi:hypothetical protein